MAKVDMKNTVYYVSGEHKKNYLLAAEKGRAAQTANKVAREIEYLKEPAHCPQCGTPIKYNFRKNKFCSSSCAAKHNNVLRGPRSDETKRKQSEATKGVPKPHTENRSTAIAKRTHPPVEIECKICHSVELVGYSKRNRKTCGSDDCRIQASVGIRSYQNGSRKPEWYFNKNDNKEVQLDSSWEVTVAKLLDERCIVWHRPAFIKWQDNTGKIRRYFPDFYLPKYDLYLDPKNPYCMAKDKDKIAAISQQVKLVVGPVEYISSVIQSLT